ncbi:MAG: hypothetical protein R3267_04605 [Paenisporosarcina sp.]|nr:hypothetical protein [Paenisporosarcina sp.]
MGSSWNWAEHDLGSTTDIVGSNHHGLHAATEGRNISMIGEAFKIYSRNWFPILMWSFIIITPITVFSYLGIVYVYSNDILHNESFLAGWLLMLNFILCIPPFLKMVKKDGMDETIKVTEGLFFFAKRFGVILLVATIVYALGLMGMYLLFIPTVVAILFLIIFPFFVESLSVWETIKQTFRKMRDENLSIIGDILVIAGLNIVLWTSLMMFLESYETSILAFLIIRVTLNVLILPVLYIYLSLRYRSDDFALDI